MRRGVAWRDQQQAKRPAAGALGRRRAQEEACATAPLGQRGGRTSVPRRSLSVGAGVCTDSPGICQLVCRAGKGAGLGPQEDWRLGRLLPSRHRRFQPAR